MDPSKNKPLQFGAIIFVDKESTSTECPYCGKKVKNKKDCKKLKFQENRYRCDGENACGFDTANITADKAFLSEINDPDKVAAYNVAKRIRDFRDICKLEAPPQT